MTAGAVDPGGLLRRIERKVVYICNPTYLSMLHGHLLCFFFRSLTSNTLRCSALSPIAVIQFLFLASSMCSDRQYPARDQMLPIIGLSSDHLHFRNHGLPLSGIQVSCSSQGWRPGYNDASYFNSAALIRRPMLAQCATAGFLFGFGDVIAQQLVEGRGKDHDVSYRAVSLLVHLLSALNLSSIHGPSG
jgi:hypothetical protein